MNRTPLALAAALCLLHAAAAAQAPSGDESLRESLARQIVDKWSGHVDRHFAIGVDTWAAEMAPAFADATPGELQAAAGARSFGDMNRILLGESPRDATEALGDAAADLVFVPVAPCRILDTRLAGGPIAANSARDFDISTVISYAYQGGEDGDCGVGLAGSFAAAVINFTVVAPGAAGYLTAYPRGAARPLAASLNYAAGQVVGNEVIVKLEQGYSINDITVYSFAQTHVVGDVVGYFAAPRATALQCQEKTATTASILAGTSGAVSTPACDAGYTITGGGCSSSSFDGRLVTTRTLASTHFCAFRNEGAGTMEGIAYSRCCRIPGR
ncbi:hypothetical protein [Arenimonas sp.]|uniref:hypothetical protein n=1 Tax=Arenimonas sp. TaxID=1872635 RepID=UPI002E375A4A|nr:hypothetical protein [Arenimonas sp.]HEX4853966.1 hypothetical protein [Arenimonas sp.]